MMPWATQNFTLSSWLAAVTKVPLSEMFIDAPPDALIDKDSHRTMPPEMSILPSLPPAPRFR